MTASGGHGCLQQFCSKRQDAVRKGTSRVDGAQGRVTTREMALKACCGSQFASMSSPMCRTSVTCCGWSAMGKLLCISRPLGGSFVSM
jgi:hypothetical protein